MDAVLTDKRIYQGSLNACSRKQKAGDGFNKGEKESIRKQKSCNILFSNWTYFLQRSSMAVFMKTMHMGTNISARG